MRLARARLSQIEIESAHPTSSTTADAQPETEKCEGINDKDKTNVNAKLANPLAGIPHDKLENL